MSALVAALTSAKSNAKKKKKVNLGKKGSFEISHPGWTKNKAAEAGESTAEWSKEHSKDKGVAGRRARSAIGLMAMGKK